jgi:hypothetical protein
MRPLQNSKNSKALPYQTAVTNQAWVDFFHEALRLKEVARNRRNARTQEQTDKGATGAEDLAKED